MFYSVFVIISNDGERKNDFNAHFPSTVIDKWSKSQSRELREVLTILKQSTFI